MATKITVALEGDLDGGPADETMRFAVGGTVYEIDLAASPACHVTSTRFPGRRPRLDHGSIRLALL